MTDSHRPTLPATLEQLALRLRDRATWLLLRSGAAAGAAGAIVAGTPGCSVAPAYEADVLEEGLLSSSVLDWAQERGTRERGMVRYEGNHWRELSDCGSRGGCMTLTVTLQLFVQPVPGVNLDDKRVGVALRRQWATQPENVLGYYVRTDWNGWEEWHVPVRMRAYESAVFSLNAWYEDGVWTDAGKRVWYDDNAGDLYPVVPSSRLAIQQLWDATRITVDQGGVRGHIEASVANFDFEKEIELVYTTDGWETVHTARIGEPGTPNTWYWAGALTVPAEGVPADYERWRIDLDLEGDVERFEYAMVYRHGLGDGARRYEFWDNNGFQNYRVERTTLE